MEQLCSQEHQDVKVAEVDVADGAVLQGRRFFGSGIQGECYLFFSFVLCPFSVAEALQHTAEVS